MATEDPTWTQLIIIVVAATVPLVYAFTHHGRARENTLALWLPFWLFVTRVTYYAPAWANSLEERVRWATVTLLSDPLTIGWPLFVWLIFFLRRRVGRASGRKDVASTEALGQGALWAEPKALIVVVPLVVIMLVAAQFADQAESSAPPTQTAVVGTTAAQSNGTLIIAIAVAALASLYLAFTLHGRARIISLVVWLPLWFFAQRVSYLAPTPWSNSLESRLQWAINESLADPATIQWPLYVFFVFALIRLFSGAPLPKVSTGPRSVSTPAMVLPASAPGTASPPSSYGGEWCTQCGAQVRAEANFCARCGFELFKQR
jgi:hypothetical protein